MRTYRGVTAPERRAERRARLIEAGLDLLADGGWRAMTMTAVCGRAKVTERYFYEHFASRDDLLASIVDDRAERMREVIITAVREVGDAHPRMVATTVVSAFLDLIAADPRTGRVLVEMAATERGRARGYELVRDFARLVAAQARVIGTPAAHADVSAMIFVGGLSELVRAWLAGEMTVSRADVVDAAADHLLAILG